MTGQAGGGTRGRFRWLLVLVLLGAGSLTLLFLRPAKPLPPAPDLAGADPALAAAIEAARARVREAPSQAKAWGKLGMLLYANDYASESIACFQQAERLDPSEPRWPYFLGVALVPTRPEEALTALRQAVDLVGGPAVPLRLRLADLLLAQGHVEEAAGQFQQVLRHAPDLALAHLGMARVAAERGDRAASLSHLERCLADPLTVRAARVLRAELFYRAGDIGASDRERRLASRLPEPDSLSDPFLEEMRPLEMGETAALARGTRLLKQGRAPDAVAFLRDTAQRYPESAPVWLALGRACQGCGWPDQAEVAFRQAVAKEPGEETCRCLGQALLQLGRVEEAAGQFRQAVAVRPSSAEAHTYLGQCLKQLGKPGEAIQAYREALRYRPNSAEAHAGLGELLEAEGLEKEAREHFDLAAALKRDESGESGEGP